MSQPDRSTARRLAAESLAQGDPTGWFDKLYIHAEGDASRIPWADRCVNLHLAAWLAFSSRVTASDFCLSTISVLL